MLTSYMVKCPNRSCDWFGSLLPHQDLAPWRGSAPTASIALFQCPQCQGEWRARIVGDDVRTLDIVEPALHSV